MPNDTELRDAARLNQTHAVPLLEAEAARRRSCKFRTLFPATGPVSRDKYWWSMAFFEAGLRHKERGIIAANQIGKTLSAGFEVVAHMTGDYPDWWPGKRYPTPTKWWLAGDTMLTTRDIQQTVMFGDIDGLDTKTFSGMFPTNLVYDVTRKSGGIAKCIDTFWIRHVSGGFSVGEFKSYDQGRKVFQGVPLTGGVWLDEEPPDPSEAKSHAEVTGAGDIYSECLTRLLTTDGMLMFTFTPLRGLTPFVKGYLETATMATREGTTIPAKTGFWPGAADAIALEA